MATTKPSGEARRRGGHGVELVGVDGVVGGVVAWRGVSGGSRGAGLPRLWRLDSDVVDALDDGVAAAPARPCGEDRGVPGHVGEDS